MNRKSEWTVVSRHNRLIKANSLSSLYSWLSHYDFFIKICFPFQSVKV